MGSLINRESNLLNVHSVVISEKKFKSTFFKSLRDIDIKMMHNLLNKNALKISNKEIKIAILIENKLYRYPFRKTFDSLSAISILPGFPKMV